MLLGVQIPIAKAAVEVSVDFFHDTLESYGDWREVGDYGYCWQPRDVDSDWRPYSDGRWVYTDAGWTWVSEEPYAWAVYHYGRWARVDRVGWVWVPGTEWGPAWVSWRRGPRHVGWAPLPPEARFARTVGFSARVDADYDIGPDNYSFVEVRNFGAPRLRTVFVEPRENITIINQTTNITRITYVNNVVYNEGPQYDVISRESTQPIRRLRLERREEFDGDPHAVRAEQLKARVEGDSLRVVAPSFVDKPAKAPRKVAAKVEKAEVDRGWKNAGTPAEVEKLRTKIKSEPAKSAEAPPQQPKKDKVEETPAAPPVPAPEPNEKPGKGKLRPGGQPKKPAEPAAPDAAPAPAEKAAPPDRPVRPDKVTKPGRPQKGPKPVKPEVDPTPAPPATEIAEPPIQPKKVRNEPKRAPAEAQSQEKVPDRKPKKESAEPKGQMPQADAEMRRQKVPSAKAEARPKSQPPIVRDMPEPPPQAKKSAPRKQVAPAVTQPQPPQPAKGKGKGKEEKKDGENPGDVPQ